MSIYVDIKKKLHNYTLDVKFETDRNTYGVLGASGCGKSMTLRCIAGIEQPDEGQIRIHDTIVFDSDKGINLPVRQRKVGYLFQNYALFPNMTVKENIGVSLGRKTAAKADRVNRQLEMFRLQGLEHKRPSELSGGEQQRVAFARMLLSDPELIMLDEPFSALDSYLKWSVEQEVKEHLDRYKKPVLFVSHNRDEIYRMCDNLAILEQGKIKETGRKEVVFDSPCTLAGAKLTGCKNFSVIRKKEKYTCSATDWGMEFTVSTEIDDKVSHLGVRARYLKIAASSKSQNVYPCEVIRMIDNLFEVQAVICRKGFRRQDRKHEIQMIVPKHDKEKLMGDSLYVEFPEDSFLFL